MATAVIAGAIAVAVGIAALLVFLRRGKEPAEGGERFVEVEKSSGCSERARKELLKEHRKLLSDAEKFYRDIHSLLGGNNPPQFVEKEYRNFMRIYNIIREMGEEIKLYPASNCREYFEEKINFYRKLMGEIYTSIATQLKL